jgi:2-hydroxychromene-2-carboxylate isomerase
MDRLASIEMYWDLGSTNSYFALKLVKPMLERHGLALQLRPYNLGYVFRQRNYVLMDEPPAKIANRKADLRRWADKYGLAFRFPTTFPVKSSKALRASIAMREWDLENAFVDAVMDAYWERDEASVAAYPGMRAIVENLGVGFDRFVALCESESTAAALAASTDEGSRRGVFGAPTIFVGDEMFWGKDRMEFVEDEIVRRRAAHARADPRR